MAIRPNKAQRAGATFNGTAHLIARNVYRRTDVRSIYLAFNRTAHLIARNGQIDRAGLDQFAILQWDRAFDSAECQRCKITVEAEEYLQWDRAFDSAE